MLAMSIGAIAGLGTNYIQSLLGSSNSTSGTTNNSTNVSSLSALTDNSQLSPFAQLMNTLQQLQQSNPTQYKQVTQDIATNLQKAATTAQSEGNTSLAAQLNQLSTDFTNASQSGQLPNVCRPCPSNRRRSPSRSPPSPRQLGCNEPGSVGLSDQLDPERFAQPHVDHRQHAYDRRDHQLFELAECLGTC